MTDLDLHELLETLIYELWESGYGRQDSKRLLNVLVEDFFDAYEHEGDALEDLPSSAFGGWVH